MSPSRCREASRRLRRRSPGRAARSALARTLNPRRSPGLTAAQARDRVCLATNPPAASTATSGSAADQLQGPSIYSRTPRRRRQGLRLARPATRAMTRPPQPVDGPGRSIVPTRRSPATRLRRAAPAARWRGTTGAARARWGLQLVDLAHQRDGREREAVEQGDQHFGRPRLRDQCSPAGSASLKLGLHFQTADEPAVYRRRGRVLRGSWAFTSG